MPTLGGLTRSGDSSSLVRGRERIRRARGESRRVRLRVAAAVAGSHSRSRASPRSAFSLEALVAALGCAVIVAVTVTDLERRIVPNRIVVPALAVALVVQTVRDPSVEWLVAAARGRRLLPAARARLPGRARDGRRQARGVPRRLARAGRRRGALRRLAARRALPAIAVLVRRGAAGRKVTLPYVPALAAGAVVALFFGDALLDAWLG